jgi:hypothetical protein
MMSPGTASQVNQFCRANAISVAETMGGEFFTNPDWEEVMHNLSQGLKSIRLVTNGDWAGSEDMANRVIGFLRSHSQFHVGVSKDNWHTNAFVDQACRLLSEAGVRHRIPTDSEVGEQTIVPVGRSSFDCSNLYGMFSCYCHNPEKKYSFLIDEQGDVFKCGFGIWKYARVADYLQGGFAARFKDFNTRFYAAFIPSCRSCQRSESRVKKP